MQRLNVISAHLSSHAVHHDSGGVMLRARATSSFQQQQHVMPKSNKRTYEDVTKMSLQELRDTYGRERPDAVQVEGGNHIAWVTSDMAKTLHFFCEVLGMKLVKTMELPDNAQHFFIDAGRGCTIAYFYFPNAPKQAPGIANVDMQALMEGKGFSTAHGSVNHVAFNVPADKLREYRKRVQEAKIGFVSPILYHSDRDPTGYTPQPDENTVWTSFYFQGPDHEYLEFTAQDPRPFTANRDITIRPAIKGYGE